MKKIIVINEEIDEKEIEDDYQNLELNEYEEEKEF